MRIHRTTVCALLLGSLGLGAPLASCKTGCGASADPPGATAHEQPPPARTNTATAAEIDWSAPVDVATGPARAGPWRMNDSVFHYVDDPTVAVHDDGSLAVAWADNRQQDLYFRAYDANGEALGDPVNLSKSPDVFSWLPRMEVDGDDVFVLWQEIVFSGGSHGGEAFFARSTDGGRSFERPTNLSNTTAGCGKGRLTEDRWDNGSLDLALGPEGTLLAAWTEYQGPLRVSRSTDGGETFSAPLHVGGTGRRPARGPSLAVADGGPVHLAWTVGEDDSADIRVATSHDGGQSFGPPRVPHRTRGHSDAPKLAVDAEGTLHLVHGESPTGMHGRYRVLHLRLNDEGEALGEARVISGPHGEREGAHFPSIALDGDDRVYVVWEHYPDFAKRPRGLGFTLSTDRGARFAPPAIVPGTGERLPGPNGSRQGLLSRKLDVSTAGTVGVVNSGFDPGRASRVRLVRGTNRRR
ncbi:MAG: sialidase family protein [Myxococcota bacterium]